MGWEPVTVGGARCCRTYFAAACVSLTNPGVVIRIRRSRSATPEWPACCRSAIFLTAARTSSAGGARLISITHLIAALNRALPTNNTKSCRAGC